MDQYKAKGYEPLVAMLRTGPPWMHRTGPLATANVNENFVHHEDMRRRERVKRRVRSIRRWTTSSGRCSASVPARRRCPGVALTLRTPDRPREGRDQGRRAGRR